MLKWNFKEHTLTVANQNQNYSVGLYMFVKLTDVSKALSLYMWITGGIHCGDL